MHFLKKFILLLLFFCMYQMPGWITYVDNDGNTFFIDGNGKMHLEGKPTFYLKAISPDGIDFYINQAKSLIKNYHKEEAIVLLQSIMLLCDKEPSLYKYASEASKQINYLIRREGDRYPHLALKNSLALACIGKEQFFSNSLCGISFNLAGEVYLLKKHSKWDAYQKLDSFMLGIKFTENKEDVYDLIVSFVATCARYKWQDVSIYKKFSLKSSEGSFDGKIIEQKRDYVLSSFTVPHKDVYSGYEAYYTKGKWGYFIRGFYCNKNKTTAVSVENFFKNLKITTR